MEGRCEEGGEGGKELRGCALAIFLFGSPLPIVVTERSVPDWHDRPPIRVEIGDLVFRRGKGFWTKYFINSSTREKRFSHVGMVVSNENDHVLLIHSEADDLTGVGGVGLSNWQSFFNHALECAVFRYNGSHNDLVQIVTKGQQMLGVPFDASFNMENTNRLYCTEFIRIAINDGLKTNLVGWTEINGCRIVAIDDIYRNGFIKVFDSCCSRQNTNNVSSIIGHEKITNGDVN